jgi:ADP-heptose:LPS heptosyltransferase
VPVIQKAEFMVTNDTGPMHIAAACNVPVFAIFGPANPARTGPYGDIHTIIREDLECSPCYAWKPCDNWKCMENISVERVLGLINERFGSQD